MELKVFELINDNNKEREKEELKLYARKRKKQTDKTDKERDVFWIYADFVLFENKRKL